jgi:hypothetical protein
MENPLSAKHLDTFVEIHKSASTGVALVPQQPSDGAVRTLTRFKVSWLQNSRRRLLVISKTPSSRHAATSSRATLQRLLREEAPS